jgi:hypothetical protein
VNPGSDVMLPDDTSLQFTTYNYPSIVQLKIVGESDAGSVLVSNRFPIKIIEFNSLDQELDVLDLNGERGNDAHLVGADISSDTLDAPGQIAWATYGADIDNRLSEITSLRVFGEFPSEIQDAATQDTMPLPDYFLLENDEQFTISVAAVFKRPGIYYLQFGVEYSHQGYSAIAWSDEIITAYAMGGYHIWSYPVDGEVASYPTQYCQLTGLGTYSCSEICKQNDMAVWDCR